VQTTQKQKSFAAEKTKANKGQVEQIPARPSNGSGRKKTRGITAKEEPRKEENLPPRIPDKRQCKSRELLKRKGRARKSVAFPSTVKAEKESQQNRKCGRMGGGDLKFELIVAGKKREGETRQTHTRRHRRQCVK